MARKKAGRNIPYIPLSTDKSDPLAVIVTDPMGSYTGRPVETNEKPVQDVDDL